MANLRADLPLLPATRGTLPLALLPAVLLAWSGLFLAAPGAYADDTPAEPACSAGNLCWTADGGAEYRRDKVILHNLVIYEGGTALRISAQSAEASTLDFSDSNWTLSGQVQVRLAQGELKADRATVHFLGGRLSAASASGAPATFEQQLGAAESIRGSELTARGHAGAIDYDLAGGEVRLAGDAWLSDGCNETSGERIVYNLAQKRVQAQGPAEGATGARVQGTIRPQCRPARPTGSTP